MVMQRAIICGLLALAGCSPSAPQLPWLAGLGDLQISQESGPATARRLANITDFAPGCGADAYRGVEMIGELSPEGGSQTIVASYAQGVFLYGGDDTLVASAPGYRCTGSADEITTLAIGDSFGHPTLVVVGVSGGRRERETWIGLFELAPPHQLEPTFAAVVEYTHDDTVERGGVMMIPSGLIYRAPNRQPRIYWFDPVARAYIGPREAGSAAISSPSTASNSSTSTGLVR